MFGTHRYTCQNDLVIDHPKVSIVTPSYNHGAFLEKTILSVIGQDYPNLEYILVDAVSQDETPKILEHYQPYIDCLIVEPDSGQTNALNKGFQRATGEFMAYLNSDDCYASATVISTAVQLFRQHPAIDVVYGQRNSINEQGYFIYCLPFRDFSKTALYLDDYIPQECVFWRRSIFERAGGYFDESFKFAMDYELWLRFLDCGANFLAVEPFWGLFRTYQDQKSKSLWETIGFPEVSRLHQKYLDRTFSDLERTGYSKEFFFGAHPETQPCACQFAEQLWLSFAAYKSGILQNAPLDTWGFAAFQHKFQNQFQNQFGICA